MIETNILPSADALKAQAKRLRTRLAEQGTAVSHSAALELIAGQNGYRDWNTLSAAAGKSMPHRSFALNERVEGRYLGQPFTGRLVALQSLSGGRRFRLTIQFDEPVDVVSFDSFSALRRRVTAVVGEDGRTVEKTSNGLPHLELTR